MSSSSLSGYSGELSSGLVGPGGAGITSAQHQGPPAPPTAIGVITSSSASGSISDPNVLDFTKVSELYVGHSFRQCSLSLKHFCIFLLMSDCMLNIVFCSFCNLMLPLSTL